MWGNERVFKKSHFKCSIFQSPKIAKVLFPYLLIILCNHIIHCICKLIFRNNLYRPWISKWRIPEYRCDRIRAGQGGHIWLQPCWIHCSCQQCTEVCTECCGWWSEVEWFYTHRVPRYKPVTGNIALSIRVSIFAGRLTWYN